MLTREQQAQNLQKEWAESPRWRGIRRGYTADTVVNLRGSLQPAHTLASRGAEKLWKLINEEPFINALGALTGNQAMQQVKAGLKAIYLSGWQVAGDANGAGEMYPDQSLYPANSVPQVVRRINNTFTRADQIQWSEGKNPGDAGYIDYFAPIVADAEAGFGGVLNAFELMKAMIDAGAAGVHFEDQLASVKKCGHMGGKVLVPTRDAVAKLIAARLAADVCGVPTVLVARTDAEAADLVTSDIDDNDKPHLTGERTVEGLFRSKTGLEQAISRGLADAPYAASCWPTTARPASTGRRTSTTAPLPNSSANWAPWATSSSSSRWRASMRSTTRCSIWRTVMHARTCRPSSSCSRPSLPRPTVASRPSSTSVRWVPAISTP